MMRLVLLLSPQVSPPWGSEPWGAGAPLEQALSWRLACRSFVGVVGEGKGES